MPHYGYSLRDYDPATMALASARDQPVSFKKSVNLCRALVGLKVEAAKKLLEQISEQKVPVQFRTYRDKVAHRRSLGGTGGAAGRYPVKAAKATLRVLVNAENNASQKNLDTESLVIVHAAAHKARAVPRQFPRAMGRMSLKRKILTHIEVCVKEVKS
ncbi:MAG: 50S ribosomal protein L22 [Thermoprotei archaeon]